MNDKEPLATVRQISFLATGSEIIHGDIQETNCHAFSKTISTMGGNIYQHLLVSDKKADIIQALTYLLGHSDAIIVTGGLGPTSDDTTRFAIAEATQHALYFDEAAWQQITKRLQQFHVSVEASNRQQALFPEGATLYPNANGTALGCHFIWQKKHIFMLPGPPKESHPLFEKYVLPTLIDSHFFSRRFTHRWLTIGLHEGEIAPRIDALAASYSVETGYRWHYPYIEIKLSHDGKQDIESLINKIDQLLMPHLISHDGKNPIDLLSEQLAGLSQTLCFSDQVTEGQLAKTLPSPKLIDSGHLEPVATEGLFFIAKTSRSLHHQTEFTGIIQLNCEGYLNRQLIYQHQIELPNRGTEVIEFATSYIAWQIFRFLQHTQSREAR